MFKSINNIGEPAPGKSLDSKYEIRRITNAVTGLGANISIVSSSPSVDAENPINLAEVKTNGSLVLLDASFEYKADSIDIVSNRFRVIQSASCGAENPPAATELAARPFIYDEDGDFHTVALNRFRFPMVKNSGTCPNIFVDLEDGNGTGLGIEYNWSVTIAFEPA